MHRPGRILASLAIAIGLVSPSAALGQSPPPRTAAERAAVAEALFDQGRRLMVAGRFAEACAKFTESERIDHGVGTLLNLADCFEQNGQTASAWAEFREAAAAASAEGQTERERIARDRERRLLPLLGRLTILVPQADVPSGLVIKRDDLIIDRSIWGVPVPIDPGEHTLVVVAPGKRTYEQTIKVPKAGGATITATVPRLADLAPAEVPAPAAGHHLHLHGRQIAGIAAGGAGIAALLAGSALGARAISRNSDSALHCRGDLCDATGVDIRHDARGLGTASTVAFLIGGAALVGGATLYFTAPAKAPASDGRRAPRAAASASVGLTPAGPGLSLGATW